MKRKRLWIKLHQRLEGHPWLNDRPEWFAAWVQILLAADNDGRVDLTEVAARDHFTRKGWRHFLDKLEAEKMINARRTVNLGREKGRRIIAQITSWSEYQSLSEDAGTSGEVGAKQRAKQNTSKGPSTLPSHTAQTQGEGPSKTGARGRARGQAFNQLRDLRSTTTAQPDHEGSVADPQDEDEWLIRTRFESTPEGRTLVSYLGPLARRMPLPELKRIAGLWTIEEMEAAWQQAKRDATKSPNKLLRLILTGEVAIDKRLLPEPERHVTQYVGPKAGQIVRRPDGTIAEVADVDEPGNWVLFADGDPVRPEACEIVEREAAVLN